MSRLYALTPSDGEASIENLRKYIQIESVSNATNYEECVAFLKGQAESIGLECEVVQLKPARPVVIMKWQGMKPHLPAILLNSHMDVVPAEADRWTHPPFAAHVDEEGRIYGRGTQDMKSVAIQYLEAVRRLKREGAVLARTLVITFVPEEETGGEDGMKLFVKTKTFRDLNVGFALDEGGASSRPGYFWLVYAEKHKWSVRFHVTGDAGHGCLNMPNTAGEKLARLLKSIYDFRDAELEKSEGRIGDANIVCINATVIQGGAMENVIPSEFVVSCDVRLPPDVDVEAWKSTMKSWCDDAGDGCWIEEVVCAIVDKPTSLDESNPYYQPFVDTIRRMGYELEPTICCGITDARYLRNYGIPVFGFSPISGEFLLHKHDEYIDKREFLAGITIYYRILLQIGYLPDYN